MSQAAKRSIPPVIWAFAIVVIGLVTVVLLSLFGPAPKPEMSDPFYTPTEPLPTEAGQLISAEPLSKRAGGPGVADGQTGWRILYSTTDHTGKIVAASGTVVVDTDQVGNELPVLAVAHGTTGVARYCAPSLAPQVFDSALPEATSLLLNEGWAAVTTDYVGLGTEGPHPYMVGLNEAHAVLDSVRAASQLPELSLTADTALWGFSQGGHAALWTASQAPDYAPELNVVGVAAMAPATSLTAQFASGQENPSGRVTSSYIAATWPTVFPDLELEDLINQSQIKQVTEVAKYCFTGESINEAFNQAAKLKKPVFNDAAFVEGSNLIKTFQANSVTPENLGIIETPVLVAQGLDDFLIQPDGQQAWVQATCAAGQDLEYRTFEGLDHTLLVGDGSALTPELIQWTLGRLAGTPVPGGCTIPID